VPLDEDRSVSHLSRLLDDRASLKTGIRLAALTLAVEAIAVLPGRIALGSAQAQLGRSPTEFAIVGTCRDVSDLALPVAAVALVALAVVMLVRRASTREGERARRHTSARVMATLLAVTGTVVYFVSAITAEFKLERGVDATWFDFQLTKGWGNPLDTFLGFMFLRRHLLPGSLALLVTCAVLYTLVRRGRDWELRQSLQVLVGFALTSAIGFGLALLPLDPHVRVFQTIDDRHVVGEPFLNLFRTLGQTQENVYVGMKALIERAEFPPAQAQGGESLLGLPRLPPRSGCDVHPFSRALPVHGVEAPLPLALGGHELEPDAAEALSLVDQISAELYAGRESTPIDVWQVMIESFRADDVHALSPSAPAALAPFTNALYDAATGGSRHADPAVGNAAVVAFRGLWQAGARTSQGVSSYMCGLGMMPYGLSVTRDFGLIPVRCLPDVLADADFDSTFFYGGPPSFDEMDTFFRDHGIKEIVGELQQPLSSPTSEVGVSDRAVVAHAVERVAGSKRASRPRFNLIMSGSNHSPYRRPDDLPPEIEGRVSSLIAHTKDFGGTSDDAARLRTFAYTDLALAELYAGVGEARDHSIFVFGADHAVNEAFVWPHDNDWTIDRALARIPYVIVFPEPLIARSAHPDALRALVRRLDDVLDRQQWSQNDTPLLLLTLLAHAPGMQALPPASRWHTLGGERTSPFFKAPRDDAKIVGIDCLSNFFAADDRGQMVMPRETATFLTSPSEIYTMSPTLLPVAATLSQFFNGYAASCRDTNRSQHARL
jgi:hypothetical protein